MGAKLRNQGRNEIEVVDAHFFNKRPNSRRNPTVREMERKRNMNGKSKLVNPMSQHGKNNSQ